MVEQTMKFEVFLIIGCAIAIASILFMANVFFNESIRGFGVLYIEPNRPLAFGELLLTAFGLIVQGFITMSFVLGIKGDKHIHDPEDSDTMPAPGMPDRRLWN
jgi:hypothetical protein